MYHYQISIDSQLTSSLENIPSISIHIRARFVSTEAKVVSHQMPHLVQSQLAVPRELPTPLCAKVINSPNLYKKYTSSFLPFGYWDSGEKRDIQLHRASGDSELKTQLLGVRGALM